MNWTTFVIVFQTFFFVIVSVKLIFQDSLNKKISEFEDNQLKFNDSQLQFNKTVIEKIYQR